MEEVPRQRSSRCQNEECHSHQDCQTIRQGIASAFKCLNRVIPRVGEEDHPLLRGFLAVFFYVVLICALVVLCVIVTPKDKLAIIFGDVTYAESKHIPDDTPQKPSAGMCNDAELYERLIEKLPGDKSNLVIVAEFSAGSGITKESWGIVALYLDLHGFIRTDIRESQTSGLYTHILRVLRDIDEYEGSDSDQRKVANNNLVLYQLDNNFPPEAGLSSRLFKHMLDQASNKYDLHHKH